MAEPAEKSTIVDMDEESASAASLGPSKRAISRANMNLANGNEVATRAELVGWALYEGSYRPYYNMTHAFVPVLLRKLAAGVVDGNGFVYFGKIPLRPAAWSTTVQTGVSIIQLLLFFFISPLADYGSHRKRIWIATTLLGGGMCTAMLVLAQPDMWLLGGLMYVFASVMWGLSNVMYNSYLPLLTSVHPGVVAETDPELRKAKVAFVGTAMSTHSFAAGFGNTVWLLLFALGLLATADTDVSGYRAIQCLIGCWWLAGSLASFVLVKTRPGPPTPPLRSLLMDMRRRTRRIVYLSRRMPNFSLAMMVAFFAGAGAASMTQISNLFADEVLRMSNLEIGLLALEAVICLLFGAAFVIVMIRTLHLSIRNSLVISLFAFAAFAAYFVIGIAPGIGWGVKSPTEMYALIALAGVAGGAVVAMGRGILASMLPSSLESEFFGYIGIIYNIAGLILPGINTAIINGTNNLRLCFLATSVAFFLSGIAMLFVHIERGVQDAVEVTNDLSDLGSLEEVMAKVPMYKWSRRRSLAAAPPASAPPAPGARPAEAAPLVAAGGEEKREEGKGGGQPEPVVVYSASAGLETASSVHGRPRSAAGSSSSSLAPAPAPAAAAAREAPALDVDASSVPPLPTERMEDIDADPARG